MQSRADRADLAAELAKQKVIFCRHLMFVEFRLALHACGVPRMPSIDLPGPLRVLQGQLSELAPARAGADY